MAEFDAEVLLRAIQIAEQFIDRNMPNAALFVLKVVVKPIVVSEDYEGLLLSLYERVKTSKHLSFKLK